MIEFENAFVAIEMFENRFDNAHVEMSQIIRDHIETCIAQFDVLTFSFDFLFSQIETSLHMQCAINFAKTRVDEFDENNDYMINIVARNEYTNATMFEIIHTQSMTRTHAFLINDELKISSIELN